MHITLKNKNILLGVTGSIAAYKTPELVRLLIKSGAHVKVILTKSGAEFVSPLTLQSLSQNEVYIGKQNLDQESRMSHIALARWADAILIAPASADFIAKIAHGFADDLLSLVCLATTAHVCVIPAMNRQMWAHLATQTNVRTLQQLRYSIWGPNAGEQACGEEGEGRMIEPLEIVNVLEDFFDQSQSTDFNLKGIRFLITAGPTIEPIDPIRYISNHSTGVMGYSLAETALKLGADVTLVTGPTCLSISNKVHAISVKTSEEMLKAVLNEINNHDVFISCAAVADYKPKVTSQQKIKKKPEGLILELQPTQDILATVAQLPKKPVLVGFAAETENMLEYSKEKFLKKKLGLLIANKVGDNQGFGDVKNELFLLSKNDSAVESLSLGTDYKSKHALAILCSIYKFLSNKKDSRSH